jgi:DNA-binding MarR family transcriptional regulator
MFFRLPCLLALGMLDEWTAGRVEVAHVDTLLVSKVATAASAGRTSASSAHEPEPTRSPNLNSLHRSLGFQLRRLQLAYKKHFIRLAADSAVQLNQVAAMRVIANNPGIAPTVLAASLTIDAAQVTSIVTQLELRGFVSRRRLASDGRGRALRLTALGKKQMVRLDATTAEVERTFVGDALSAEEHAQLLSLLERLRRSRIEDRD